MSVLDKPPADLFGASAPKYSSYTSRKLASLFTLNQNARQRRSRLQDSLLAFVFENGITDKGKLARACGSGAKLSAQRILRRFAAAGMMVENDGKLELTLTGKAFYLSCKLGVTATEIIFVLLAYAFMYRAMQENSSRVCFERYYFVEFFEETRSPGTINNIVCKLRKKGIIYKFSKHAYALYPRIYEKLSVHHELIMEFYGWCKRQHGEKKELIASDDLAMRKKEYVLGVLCGGKK
jgi:hypothetical protein